MHDINHSVTARTRGELLYAAPIQIVKFRGICADRSYLFNSLAPGKCQFNFRQVMFKLILVNGSWGISYEIALRWMPLDVADDKSTLVQVMAWCRQATIHYLSQCWPRSLSPYGVIRPQCIKCQCPNGGFPRVGSANGFVISKTTLPGTRMRNCCLATIIHFVTK